MDDVLEFRRRVERLSQEERAFLAKLMDLLAESRTLRKVKKQS